jgi:hypothetical protein
VGAIVVNFNYFGKFAVRLVNNFFYQSRPILGSLSGVSRGRLGSALAPSSHCSILIEIPMAGKASRDNDLSIALGATMDLTNMIIRPI